MSQALSQARPPDSRQALASSLALTVRDGVGELTLDLPGEKLNMLRECVMEELRSVLSAVAVRTDIRCLVVKSGKPGSFIAGADLNEIGAITDGPTAAEKSRAGQEVLNLLEDLPFPTVALIDGPALGGGLELALACDYRIVTDDPRTSLGLPETGFGIIPGFGGTYRLPRTVGLARAVQMILSGRPLDGPHAEKAGLADACYPAAFAEEKTAEFVQRAVKTRGRPAARRRRRPLSRRLAEGTPVGRVLLFRAARKQAERGEGRHYPALREALRVLRRTTRAGRTRALAVEREAVSRLIPTAVARNLIRIFFAREAAKRASLVPAGERPRRVSRAAVLGAGVMGGRIAWLFTRYDIPVVMKDVEWEAVRKGYGAAFAVYQELRKRRRFDDREINLKMHRLSGAVDYRGLGSPELVVEAVVESPVVKRKVLAEVEQEVAEDALIASNTSSLSITEMAGALRRPERFAGMHFFNPPNIMPLVEVVPGARTSPQTVAALCAAAVALGKTPIVVRDCPGFLVNRLLVPYLNECLRLADEGCSYLAVDRLLSDFGMPMGPFRLLDEIGIDIAREVGRVLSAAYGSRMELAGLFGALAGRKDLLGKKTGRGFYLHGSGTARSMARSMARSTARGAPSPTRR